jgi:outer membrane protein assembly factor BamE (lipoprotein component of BamABCDE complex)
VNPTIVLKKPTLFASCLLALVLAGCNASLPSAPKIPKLQVYKIDIAQGNIIDATQLAQLTEGMSKRHVQVLLGTPLLQDPFHPERWDYLYSLQPGGEKRQQRNVSLYFNDQEELVRLEGDVVGELRQNPLEITRTKTTVNVPALTQKEKEGFWRGLRRRLPLIGGGDAPPPTPAMTAQTVAVPAAPAVSATTETPKPGFWQRMRGWIPFTGDREDETPNDKTTQQAPEVPATVSPVIEPTIPTTADNLSTRPIAAESVLRPGMALSELNPEKEPDEEIKEEAEQERDDHPGLFDGLLRKIGR